jgi:hypothetical protein
LEIISHMPQLNMRNTVALQGGTFNRIQGSFDLGGRLNQDGTLLWRLHGLVRRRFADQRRAQQPHLRRTVDPLGADEPHQHHLPRQLPARRHGHLGAVP